MPPRTVSAAELALHFHAAREIGGADQAVKYALAAAERQGRARLRGGGGIRARGLQALSVWAPHATGTVPPPAIRRTAALAGRRPAWGTGAFCCRRDARQLGDTTQFARAALGYAGRSYDAEAVDPLLRRLFTEALATLPENETSLRAKLLARLAEALHPVDRRAIELTDQALGSYVLPRTTTRWRPSSRPATWRSSIRPPRRATRGGPELGEPAERRHRQRVGPP